MRRLALAVLFVGHAAFAQPAELTKEFQAGVDAFRLGKLDEARAHLEKARDIDPKLPGPYRFLAAVAHGEKNWDDCIANAHQALALNPRSSEAADTRKLYEECRQSAGRPAFNGELGDSAAIAVTTNVTGATVKINGLTYGATPISPRPITAGALEIEISKQGWKPTSLEVNALAGIVTDVSQELEPAPDAQATELHVEGAQKPAVGWLVVRQLNDHGPPPDPYDDANEVHLIDGQEQTGTPDPKGGDWIRYELAPGTHVIEIRNLRDDPWRRRVRISAGQKTELHPVLVSRRARASAERRGFYVLGAGGALLVGGFITAMISRDAAAEARDIVRIETARDPSQPLSVTGQIAPVRTRTDLNDARDRASRFAIISDVAYGAGLVAVGVGAYYLYKGERERTDVPPPFAIAPTHGGVFVAKELAW
jgi:hypothetical protein